MVEEGEAESFEEEAWRLAVLSPVSVMMPVPLSSEHSSRSRFVGNKKIPKILMEFYLVLMAFFHDFAAFSPLSLLSTLSLPLTSACCLLLGKPRR